MTISKNPITVTIRTNDVEEIKMIKELDKWN